MSEQALISARNIAVTYRRRSGLFGRTVVEALKDISFDLYRGESLGILGRNGAGKSTLLRLLAGVIVPDRGEILTQDEVSISMLALQAGFENELSGRKNILLNGLLLGFSKAEVEACTQEIVDFSELGRFIDEPVKTYSTGMKARLGFSIAYTLQPEILLVDEVLGVGDASFRKKSGEAMREKIKSRQTIVLVSHSAAAIKQLCTRAIWVEGGVVRAEGNPVEVVDEYESFTTSE